MKQDLYTVAPIQVWPGLVTRNRKGSPFRATFSQTSELLEKELRALGGRNALLQMAVTRGDIRLDGKIRANARPEHPGVILTFDSRHGPLSYPCDTFDDWQDNLRAIALGLEALRKVDRYGVTKRGEQYRGFLQIGSGANGMFTRGRDLIEQHGGLLAALKATHPDAGGDPDDFRAVVAVRDAP